MLDRENLRTVCSELEIKLVWTPLGCSEDVDGWKHRAWRVRLSFEGRSLTTSFKTGMAISEPDVPSVVSSLCSDALAGEQSFSDFCSDFGYDEDSRKAEKIWKACRAVSPRVRRFLSVSFDRCAEAEW